MLSLLKKKTEASPASLLPSWHPNFRRFEALPDIKPVRTAFFVNGIAAFIACREREETRFMRYARPAGVPEYLSISCLVTLF